MTDRQYIDMAVAAITTITLVKWELCPCIVNYATLRPRVHAIVAHDLAALLADPRNDGWEDRTVHLSLAHIQILEQRRREFSRGLHAVGAGAAFEDQRRDDNGIQPTC